MLLTFSQIMIALLELVLKTYSIPFQVIFSSGRLYSLYLGMAMGVKEIYFLSFSRFGYCSFSITELLSIQFQL